MTGDHHYANALDHSHECPYRTERDIAVTARGRVQLLMAQRPRQWWQLQEGTVEGLFCPCGTLVPENDQFFHLVWNQSYSGMAGLFRNESLFPE
jgi:hypothetical protein